MNRLMKIVVLILLASFATYTMTYVVEQRRIAIVFSWGEIKEVVTEPGLHFKLPAPFQNVQTFDNRLQTLETARGDRFITAEKMNVEVDAFAKWRISDPRRFYVKFHGDMGSASNRMQQILKAALNEEITKRDVHQLISQERGQVMAGIHRKVAAEATEVGVDIIDVRILRVEYLEQNNVAVFERMKSERNKVANKLRASGFGEAETIRAEANLKRTLILSDAYKQAETVRGEGDGKASRIYAEAFGQNPEFYKFYRSLEAYRASFKNHSDVMVLDPSSEFFKYFKGPGTPNSK